MTRSSRPATHLNDHSHEDHQRHRLDTAFFALHEGDRPQTPKGQSPVTAKLVREALQQSTEPRTAAEIADEVGVSRATAQRYLAALAEDGKAQMALRYGATGRPEHQYDWL